MFWLDEPQGSGWIMVEEGLDVQNHRGNTWKSNSIEWDRTPNHDVNFQGWNGSAKMLCSSCSAKIGGSAQSNGQRRFDTESLLVLRCGYISC
jgi:hypothetical protein